MKVNVLTGSTELGEALRRYLRYVMGIERRNIRLLLFGGGSGLSREILDADFWLAEAFNPEEPENPEGFRALKVLSGKKRSFLLFLFPPDRFPEDGPFWCTLPCSNLKERLEKAMTQDPPTQKDFQRLIDLWPNLGYDLAKHRHHGHRS